MTGWESDACTKLLRLARAQISLPSVPASNFLVEEGLIVNATTGVVQGPNLVLDAGPYGYCAPLYTYDRTNRFACLLMPAGVPNEVAARIGLVLPMFRPVTQAAKVTCPALVLICETDTVAPASAAEKAAAAMANATVKRYPVGHFDIYQGEARDISLADQLEFLQGL